MWNTTIRAEELSYIFELSNVVNGQKFKKLLIILEQSQKKMWAKYGHSVKLLEFGGKPFFP